MENIKLEKLIDMHIHTLNGSFDATNMIDEIIKNAKKNDCKYVGITDHNSFAALEKIKDKYNLQNTKSYWEVDGIKIVPGVEVTCKIDINEIPKTTHLLVYVPNIENSHFKKLVEIKNKHDYYKNRFYLDYVAENLGIKLDNKQVNEYVRKKNISTFNTKTTREFLETDKEHFNIRKYNSLQKYEQVAKISDFNLNVEDVVSLAHSAGGICVVAHPTSNFKNAAEQQEAAKKFAQLNIDGIEVKYNHELKAPCTKFVNNIVRERKVYHCNKKLIFSAGSDNHKITKTRQIGKLYINTKSNKQSLTPLKAKDYSIINELEKKNEIFKQKQNELPKTSYLKNVIYYKVKDLKICSSLKENAFFTNSDDVKTYNASKQILDNYYNLYKQSLNNNYIFTHNISNISDNIRI